MLIKQFLSFWRKSGMLHDIQRMNARFSTFFCRAINIPFTSCSKLKQMVNNHSFLTLGFFEGCDVGTAFLRLQKCSIIERAGLNRKSINDIATED